MKFLCVNIVEGEKWETIDVDENFDGKVIEGFNIETYNKHNDKITTFIPKDTFVKVYKEAVGMIYTQAMNLLVSGCAIRRKSWGDDEFILKIKINDKSHVYKFFKKHDKYHSSNYIFLDDDIFASDYELYELDLNIPLVKEVK